MVIWLLVIKEGSLSTFINMLKNYRIVLIMRSESLLQLFNEWLEPFPIFLFSFPGLKEVGLGLKKHCHMLQGNQLDARATFEF